MTDAGARVEPAASSALPGPLPSPHIDAQAAVRLKAITRSFGPTVKALDAVSLDIPKGQFCVVLGPSGSGKTTLLRSVNGLAGIDGGQIEVCGMALSDRTRARVRARIGMVHQHFGLIDQLSVAQNVLAGASRELGGLRLLLRRYRARHVAQACSLMESVGLDPSQANRKARELSGGQRQRAGIARALMLDPQIILADEPVASLDPRIAGEVMALLKDATRARGVTVLCSLHQVDLALAYADRIVALRRGRVVFDGRPDALDARTIAAVYQADSDVGASACAASPADHTGS